MSDRKTNVFTPNYEGDMIELAPDELLDSPNDDDLFVKYGEAMAVKQQRDELLAMLESAYPLIEECWALEHVNEAKALITKVKGSL